MEQTQVLRQWRIVSCADHRRPTRRLSVSNSVQRLRRHTQTALAREIQHPNVQRQDTIFCPPAERLLGELISSNVVIPPAAELEPW